VSLTSFCGWPGRFGPDVEKSASHQLSQSEIGSSIKGDVNKKTSRSAGDREVFCLDIQPTVGRWLSIAREVLLWTTLPFPRFIFEW
jgi:hypothetical protein